MAIDWSGLVGSAVGTVAAVGVGQWTTRRPISADRDLLYEERRHRAASRTLQELAGSDDAHEGSGPERFPACVCC